MGAHYPKEPVKSSFLVFWCRARGRKEVVPWPWIGGSAGPCFGHFWAKVVTCLQAFLKPLPERPMDEILAPFWEPVWSHLHAFCCCMCCCGFCNPSCTKAILLRFRALPFRHFVGNFLQSVSGPNFSEVLAPFWDPFWSRRASRLTCCRHVLPDFV